MQRICVYAGSAKGTRAIYAEAARELGSALAARKIGLVYGGGAVGLMGVVADAALAGGGEVIGVIPRQLAQPERAHIGITELRIVPNLHRRKALMAVLADAFIALPGGFGTLDELLEMITWGQLGLHEKRIGLLDAGGFYAPLVAHFDHLVAEGFAAPETRAALRVAPTAAGLLEAML